MDKNNAFIKAFPLTWVVTTLVAVPTWIFAGKLWGASIVLGSVTTLMMMSMMYKTTLKIVDEKSNVQRRVVMGYIFRYLFYAMILVAAAFIDGLSVIGVAIGFMIFRICLYIALFWERRKEVKQNG